MYTIKCQFNTIFLVEKEQKKILLCTQNLKKKKRKEKKEGITLKKCVKLF